MGLRMVWGHRNPIHLIPISLYEERTGEQPPMFNRMKHRLDSILADRFEPLFREGHPQCVGFKGIGIGLWKVFSSEKCSLAPVGMFPFFPKSSHMMRHTYFSSCPPKGSIISRFHFLENIHLRCQEWLCFVRSPKPFYLDLIPCLLKESHSVRNGP